MDKKNLDLLSTQTLYCKTKHIKNRGEFSLVTKSSKWVEHCTTLKAVKCLVYCCLFCFSLLLPFLLLNFFLNMELALFGFYLMSCFVQK